VLAIAVLVLSGLSIPAPAIASSLPELFTNGGFGVRPKTPLHLSGDSTVYFAGAGGFGGRRATRSVSWTSWNAHAAVGRGALYLNNCEPDCARGKFIGYPGTLRAFSVKPRIFVGFVGSKFVRIAITFRHAGSLQTATFRFEEKESFAGWIASTILRLP
jgi:hypothetical protein